MKKKSLFICLLFLISGVCFAEEEANIPEMNYFSDFFNMVISLIFIIVLILVSTWFIKRLGRTRLRHMNQSAGIKILERRILHAKASLYLVDVLGKKIVIAESPQGIHPITEFPVDTAQEELIPDLPQASVKPPLTFSEILNKLRQKIQR